MSSTATSLFTEIPMVVTDTQQACLDTIQRLGMPQKAQETWRYAPLEPLFARIRDYKSTVSGDTQPVSLTALSEEYNVFVPATLLAPSSQQHLTYTQDQRQTCSLSFTHTWEQPLLVVTVKEGVSATLRLSLSGQGAGHLLCLVTLEANASAQIEVIGHNLDTPVLVSIRSTQAEESRLNVVSHLQNNAWFRLDVANTLLGEGAQMHLNSLSLLKHDQYAGVLTDVRHSVGHAESHQVVKSILYDRALSEYSGGVFVAPDAQKTDSSQSNPNLVLSDHARAVSRPQLRIYADDVKCAHGATMGQLDPEPLFYLASRGFSQAAAISMILTGFAEDVIDHISDPEDRATALREAQAFLHTGQQA